MASAIDNALGRNRKSARLRPLPPDVNARNLAIEKQRREALNEKFLLLARLTGLDTAQRPSKVLIVNKCIRELEQQQLLYNVAMQNLQYLMAENERLTAENDSLRSQTLGIYANAAAVDLSANTGHQLNLINETQSCSLGEIEYSYVPTSSSNADLTGLSVQSEQYPSLNAYYPPFLMPYCESQGEFGMGHFQIF